MTLQYTEGFDGTVAAPSAGKWSSGWTISGGSGRTPSVGQANSGSSANPTWTALLESHDTYTVGVAMQGGPNSPGQSNDKFRVQFAETTIANVKLTIMTTNAGGFEIRQGTSTGTVIGTTSGFALLVGFQYVEFKVRMHPTAGSVEIHINEFVRHVQTGMNTGTGLINLVGLRADNQVSAGFLLDDIYICSGSGAKNNSFLGDTRIERLVPSGNGSLSQWVGNDGNSVDNYLLVDDNTYFNDGDSTYVTSDIVGNTDLYAHPDSVQPTTRVVHGVVQYGWARRDDAGFRSIAFAANANGTTAVGTDQSLAQTYAHFYQPWDNKPNGAAWTIPDVNAAEFGIQARA